MVNFIVSVDSETKELPDVVKNALPLSPKTVESARVEGDNLILVRQDGTEIDAGDVRGEPGPNTIPTQQVIEAALADNSTVITAAAAAVTDAIEDAGVVRFVDPAIPAVTTAVPDVSFAIVDSAGRLSDIAVGTDGRLMSHTIEYIRGKLAGTVTSAPEYDIIVVGGQSNSATGSYLESTGFREVDSLLYLWSGSAIIPMPAKDINLGTEFARAYARDFAKTGRRVLVVQTGVPSVGFTTSSINPAPAGYYYNAAGTIDRNLTADPLNRYTQMIAAVTAARTAAGAASRLAAVVWSQGESDKGLTQAEYAAKLDDLISAARTAWGVADLPFLIGSMTPEMHVDHPDCEGVARALADTPHRVLRTGFVWGPANGHRYFQTVHFSAPGQIERAGRLAREGLIEALNNQTAIEPVAPLNLRVSRVGGTAVLLWDRPWCHVDSMTVQFSIDAGTTWTNATVDTMHGSRATATVAAGTVVRFRITVTNSIGTTMPAEIEG
jgi:hypothetical protein